MPSVDYDHGELEHILVRENLKLKTNSFLTFSSPLFAPSFPTGTIDLETMMSSDAQIHSGNRLQLHVQLTFDDVKIKYPAGRNIIEDLGVMLCNSEVLPLYLVPAGRLIEPQIWSQLRLDASLSISGIDIEGGEGRGYQDGYLLDLIRKHDANVDAPGDFPSACLESIRLVFRFSTCRRTRVLPNTQRLVKVAGHDVGQTGMLNINATNDHLDSHLDSAQLLQAWPREHINAPGQENHRQTGSLPDTESLSWDESYFPTTAAWLATSQTKVSPNPSQSSMTGSLHSSRPSSEKSIFIIHEATFENVVNLLNASLSLLICDRRNAKRRGVILSSDSGFSRLVAISPVFFSPGYLEVQFIVKMVLRGAVPLTLTSTK